MPVLSIVGEGQRAEVERTCGGQYTPYPGLLLGMQVVIHDNNANTKDVACCRSAVLLDIPGACMQELDEPAFGHFFVKKLVARALDKHNHEREMASLLLPALAGEVRTIHRRPRRSSCGPSAEQPGC